MTTTDITSNDIATAAAMGDLDRALRHLMDIAGITSDDVLQQHFSGFDNPTGDWLKSTIEQRKATIVEWLEVESAYEKMSFEEFVATKQWSDNLARDVESENWETEGTPKGNIYLGCLYIDHIEPYWPESARKMGKWHLVLNRNEWFSNDLVDLERTLYEWAVKEGYSLQ